jgi:hypothetical protein
VRYSHAGGIQTLSLPGRFLIFFLARRRVECGLLKGSSAAPAPHLG